jgi:hypothetical protein
MTVRKQIQGNFRQFKESVDGPMESYIENMKHPRRLKKMLSTILDMFKAVQGLIDQL